LTGLSKSVKTCDDVNISWEFNNQADFVAYRFIGFSWILDYNTSLRGFD